MGGMVDQRKALFPAENIVWGVELYKWFQNT